MSHSPVHLWAMLRTWWDGRSIRTSGDTTHQEGPVASNASLPLRVNGQEFETFLHTLGVCLEDRSLSSDKEGITLLQRSRHYDAFYRIDLVAGHPHLLVLLPGEDLLRIEGYLVRFHVSHPLFGMLVPLITGQGSMAFEQGRGDLEELMLFTLAEAMKSLFWLGVESGQFPSEILVERLSFEAHLPQA